jgi:hypothetical protein
MKGWNMSRGTKSKNMPKGSSQHMPKGVAPMSSPNHNWTLLRLVSILALFFFALSTYPIGSFAASARVSETEHASAADPGPDRESEEQAAQDEPETGEGGEPQAGEEPPEDEGELEDDKKGGGLWKYLLGGAVLLAGGIVLLVSGGDDEPSTPREPLPDFPDPPEDGK